MFEIGIFCVIFLAVAYWAVLWLMGRREDVLHGEFVKSEPPADEPLRPVFPKRPMRSAPPERPVEAGACATAVPAGTTGVAFEHDQAGSQSTRAEVIAPA
jgi:hypothetical protein